MALTPTCALIAASVAEGDWADLRHLKKSARAVPAEFIRQLLLGQPLARAVHKKIAKREPGYEAFVPADDAPVPVASPGLRLRGAVVVGMLNLADCCGVGGVGLPALVLEDCELEGDNDASGDLDDDDFMLALDLSRSRIARLSLKGSQFGYVRVRETVIEGGVDISGVSPAGGWTPRPWPGADMAAFRAAMLRGSIASQDTVGRRSGSGLERTREYCWVDLTGSKIGGDVAAIGAKLRTPPARSKRYHYMDTRYALALTQCTIGGSLIAYGEIGVDGETKVDRRTVFDGGLNLHLVVMQGEVWLGGALLIKREREGSSLDGQGAAIGGLYAAGKAKDATGKRRALAAFGGFYLNAATISGHFHLKSCDIDGDGASALQAEGMTVGGDLLLQSDTQESEEIFAARGPVRLEGSTIGGLLDIAGTLIDGKSAQPENTRPEQEKETDAFDGSFMRIGSEARLGDLKAKGCIWLRGARIEGELNMERARLDGDGAEAFDGSFMTVGRDARLDNLEAAGCVWLRSADIGDSLCLNGVQIVPPRHVRASAEEDAPIAVDLARTTISGSLRLKDNDLRGGLRLTHAHANVLYDRKDGYGAAEPIDLKGFTYVSLDECDLSIDDEPKGCATSRVEDWLSRMPKHHPQPYAHLAKVLGAEGRPVEARDILIAKHDEDLKQRRQAIELSRPLHAVLEGLICFFAWLFGRMFGYGLKPARAIGTIIVAFLLGWLVIAVANSRGAMVVDQQPIAGVFQGDQLGAAETGDPVYHNVECGDAIQPWLYALDVFIPLVDFRQESKCEIAAARRAETILRSGEVGAYRFFKAVYALAGWLIISLAILTFSGVLQRRGEQ